MLVAILHLVIHMLRDSDAKICIQENMSGMHHVHDSETSHL